VESRKANLYSSQFQQGPRAKGGKGGKYTQAGKAKHEKGIREKCPLEGGGKKKEIEKPFFSPSLTGREEKKGGGEG